MHTPSQLYDYIIRKKNDPLLKYICKSVCTAIKSFSNLMVTTQNLHKTYNEPRGMGPQRGCRKTAETAKTKVPLIRSLKSLPKCYEYVNGSNI